MKKILTTTIFCFIALMIISIAFFPNHIFAKEEYGWQTTGCPDDEGFVNPLGTCDIFKILKDIIGYLILIAAPIVVIMVLYGGFLILTAGDSPEKVQGGRKTIQWAAIGYAIILCSWGIIYIIGEILGTDLVK